MQLDQFLVITREKGTGCIQFMGPMTGAELERAGEGFQATSEVFGVPLTDVLALAGDHDDSGPMRMMQPMTVDQVALRITAALFVGENAMTELECVQQAWDTAALFMTEAMQRDAMGVPLQSDEPDEGETEDGQEKNGEGDEKENGQGQPAEENGGARDGEGKDSSKS